METNTITQADYTELCAGLPDNSVDMILTDPPYAVHEAVWDNTIDLNVLFSCMRRIIKLRGAIVMTSQQPFTTDVINAGYDIFKYASVWIKSNPTDPFNAKNRPMRQHEDILVFSLGTTANGSSQKMAYYPQGLEQSNEIRSGLRFGTQSHERMIHKRDSWQPLYKQTHRNYPTSVINISHNVSMNQHPNQKPVALFEYLIRTYTQAGEIVLDPFAGSGTTAVACIKTNRRYIIGDQSAEYVELARKRVATCDPFQDTPVDDGVTQLSMFSSVSEAGHD